MYDVYILQSQKDNSSYKGFTTDLQRQLAVHNSSGKKYTSTKAPFALIWYCAFLGKKQALRFERYLKSGSGFVFAKRHLIPIALHEYIGECVEQYAELRDILVRGRGPSLTTRTRRFVQIDEA